jgi:hypothetical protein
MSLPRDENGVRRDVRDGDRLSDRAFSEWHRQFPNRRCYGTDIDFLEYRFENGVLVLKAVFDVKESHVEDTELLEENAGHKAYKKLAEFARIPFYVIWVKLDVNGKITRFKIWNTSEPRAYSKEMSPDEMKNFIESIQEKMKVYWN